MLPLCWSQHGFQVSNITFHLRSIWLQPLAVRIIIPDIVSKLLRASIWSRCAVWFLNLSRRPVLGQIVDLDLLLYTGFHLEHAVLFLCHIFTQWPMNDRKIERSNERGFSRKQLLANSIQNFISHEERVTRHGPIFTKHWPFWLLNLVSIARVVVRFPKRTYCSHQRLRPTRKRPVFVLARLTRPSCAWALPQELGHRFCSQNLRLSSGIAFESDSQKTGRGLNLDSNLNSATWPMGYRGFICSEPQINVQQTVWVLNSF